MLRVFLFADDSDPPQQHLYSVRIEQLLQHAAELGKEARNARADDERRTIDALASMYEGTARSFAHLQVFRAVLSDTSNRSERRRVRKFCPGLLIGLSP